MEIRTRYKNAFASLPSSIVDAQANIETIKRTNIWIKDGRLNRSQAFDQTKIYAYSTEKSTGMVYTEDTEEDPVEVFKRAALNSRYITTSPMPMNSASDSVFPDKGRVASEKELETLGIRIEALLSEYETVEFILSSCNRYLATVNTKGLDTYCISSWVELHLEIRSPEDRNIEATVFLSSRSIDLLNPEQIAEKARKEINKATVPNISETSIASGKYPAVLSGLVMRNIFMTAWLEFSAQRMHRGSSVFSDNDISKKIASSVVNIINTPEHALLGQCWDSDSEGSRVQRQEVVSNGVFTMPLYTLESLGTSKAHAGCGGRVPQMTGNIPITLTTVPSALYFQEGGSSEDQLVSELKDGLLITYSLDLFHSVNISSGDFSIPCGGFLIKDGKKVGKINQLTMVGNIKDLLLSIQQFGSDLAFDYFYFRTYCIGSPSALVRDLSFSC